MTSRQRRRMAGTLAAAACLGACGGGGGVASPGAVAPPVATATTPVATPAPAQPTPAPTLTPADLIASPRPAQRSANDTAEFRVNYDAEELIGLLYAPDAGLTGRGVTVGVIDGGFTTSAPDLAGRQSSLSRDFGAVVVANADGTTTTTARNDVAADPASDHGSIVAELIAAVRDGRGGVGVAPDATLAYLRVDDVRPGQPNADGTINATLTSANITAAIRYAADVRLPVVNFSLGVTGGASATLTAALDRYAATGGLFVIAAGNDGAADPGSIQLLSNANRSNWISVGGLSSATDAFALDADSNRAGSLADRYLVAAYEAIAADPAGTGFFRFSGTSGAAPQVAGAAALVLQKWPQLSGRQAGDVLLATARDIGAAGTDPVFGRGLLDIKAALSPVDPVLVTATGSTVPLAAATLALPAAFGTGKIAAVLARTVVLDRFGRDFAVDAHGLVGRAGTIGGVAGLVRTVRRTTSAAAGFTVSSDIALAGGPVRAGEPTARFAGTAVTAGIGGATLAFTQGYAPWSGTSVAGLGPPASALAAYAGGVGTGLRTIVPFAAGALTLDVGTGAAAAFRGYGATRVDAAALGWSRGRWSLAGGIVAEAGSLFGTRAPGALRLGAGAATLFAEARYGGAVGAWWLSGYGSLGRSRVHALDGSLFGRPSPLVTSRFGVEAARAVGPGIVTLGLAQPLNVERGAATLTVADGYSLAERALTFAGRRVDLRGDRQVQAQAAFDLGPVRFGLVQGLVHAETGVVSTLGWRF